MFAFALVAALIAGAASRANADTIILNSGRSLEGAVTAETPSDITLRTGVGTIRVSRSDIREWRRSDRVSAEVDGDSAFAAGRLEPALQHYQEALRQVPVDSAAATRLRERVQDVRRQMAEVVERQLASDIARVNLMLDQDRLDEAQALVEGMLARMPNDGRVPLVTKLQAEVHFRKAARARDMQNRPERARQLAAAVAAYPDHFRARLAYGEMLLENSATEQEGLQQIAVGLERGEGEIRDEERARYHYLAARKYFDRRDYQNAASNFAACGQVKNLPPECADALDRAAESYLRMSEENIIADSQKTIGNLNQALRWNPQNKSVHFLLGRIYRDTGQTSAAIEAFRQVIAIDDKYKNVHHALALAHLDRSEYDEALAALDKELETTPRNYDAMLDRAETLMLQGSVERARTDVDRAVAQEPERWRGYLMKAKLETLDKNYADARKSLERLLDLKRDSAEGKIQLGRIEAAEKNFDKAREWLEEVVDELAKKPTGNYGQRLLAADARTVLGQIEMEQGSPRAAETRFRQALEIVPTYAPALAGIGDVRRSLGADTRETALRDRYYRDALNYYQEAIGLASRNPEYHLKVGVLYHNNIKDTARAIISYQAYLDLGGRDRTTVQNWINECGTPGALLPETTTATVATTTGTEEAAVPPSEPTPDAATETKETAAAEDPTTGT